MRPSNFPESYTRYKIWVKAFTFKNEGRSSQPIEVLTDVTGPGAPLFRNVSCVNDVTLSLEWAMPINWDRSVDYFVIQYRKTVGGDRGDYYLMHQVIILSSFHLSVMQYVLLLIFLILNVDIVLTIDDFKLLFYSKLESQGLETSFPRLSLSMM